MRWRKKNLCESRDIGWIGLLLPSALYFIWINFRPLWNIGYWVCIFYTVLWAISSHTWRHYVKLFIVHEEQVAFCLFLISQVCFTFALIEWVELFQYFLFQTLELTKNRKIFQAIKRVSDIQRYPKLIQSQQREKSWVKNFGLLV